MSVLTCVCGLHQQAEENTGTRDTNDTSQHIWLNEKTASETESAGSGEQLALFSSPGDQDRGSRIMPQMDPNTANMLKNFLQDPILNGLNQKPSTAKQGPSPIVTPQVSPSPSTVTSTPKLFSQDPTGMNTTPDSSSRVSMWNPIVSTAPKSRIELNHKEYRNFMLPTTPFKKPLSQDGTSSAAANTVSVKSSVSQFSRVQKIKLSITRMEPAVSFCRTHTSPGGGKMKSTVIKEYECYPDKLKQQAVMTFDPCSRRGQRSGLPDVHEKEKAGEMRAQSVKPHSERENGVGGEKDKFGDTLRNVAVGNGKGKRGGKTQSEGNCTVSQYPANPSQLQPPLWRLTSYKTNKENFSLEHDAPEKNKGQTPDEMTLKILQGIRMDLAGDRYSSPVGIDTIGNNVRFTDEGNEGHSKGRQTDKRGPALASGVPMILTFSPECCAVLNIHKLCFKPFTCTSIFLSYGRNCVVMH